MREPHQWKVTSFHSPTQCQLCGKMLWGLTKQGVVCARCHIIAHKKCTHLAGEQCKTQVILQAGDEKGRNHDWVLQTYRKPTYCSVCTKILWGLTKQGYECSICRVIAHECCIPEAVDTCRPVSVTNHHFIRACMGIGAHCFACGESFHGSDGYKCSRCKLKIHQKCFEGDPQRYSSNCVPKHSELLFQSDSCPSTVSSSVVSSTLETKRQQPVIAFVNSRSGGGQGKAVFQKLRQLLSRDQVFDLAQGGPKPGLLENQNVENLTILCCGGDGTCGWVLSVLDDIGWPQPYPPVAILPLGTGNDLSRALGWGPGYQDESLSSILNKITSSTVISLDRWKIWHLPDSTLPICNPPVFSSDPPPSSPSRSSAPTGGEIQRVQEEAISGVTMNNYWSVGVDAMVALEFHTKREEHPNLFTSRTVNKGWYGWYGMRKMAGTLPLKSYLNLWMDGTRAELSEKLEGLIVLNIAFYAGGCDLWGKEERNQPVSATDGLLEVVGITGTFHMAKIQTGAVSAKRLGQAETIKIELSQEMATQVDGEPQKTLPGSILINHHTSGTMLACENSPSLPAPRSS